MCRKNAEMNEELWQRGFLRQIFKSKWNMYSITLSYCKKKKMACLFCLLEFYGLGYFYAILNALDI